MKPTLFGVRCHLLHESNEVEQELSVVVGQFQIIAVLPGEQTRHFKKVKTRSCNIYALLYLPFVEGHTTQSGYAQMCDT